MVPVTVLIITMKPHSPKQMAQYWLENRAFRFSMTVKVLPLAASMTTRSSMLKKQMSRRIRAITA